MEEKKKEAIQPPSPKTESALSKTVKAMKEQNLGCVSFSTI